ncbi:acetyl-CoA carboxylase biotin carboxyl carrier protein [Moraxella canis]|uniref:Biotin carboxyl carrier protein of acetyl-CoA carboxylase n=1 Tax=Moraxella canis TaxID=90239 RepID=A0ABZ0WYD5_9GAMM|nr:acetyl-CoA carboxylase biotin carboxyl carrier protein [Moraxella canis]WQE04055.1 acetyl-CoA carboxylase biotin carboxyl carrier protein [Moraxella canis]
MDINFEQLAKIINLVELANIHALEVQDGQQKIHIKKYADSTHAPQTTHHTNLNLQSSQSPTTQTEQINSQISQQSSTSTNTEPNQTHHTILSPMLGTFYRKSSPEMPNFVNVGDAVKQGDKLCIIEAMKIMHEVKTEKDGVVREILVEDGDMVEYDAPLFVIE